MLQKQWRQLRFLMGLCCFFVLVLFVSIYFFSQHFGILASEFTRDIIGILGLGAHMGTISILGSMLWAVSAGICIFSAWTLQNRQPTLRLGRFLLFSGAVSVLLALDDALLLHDEIFPKYLGIPEKGFYLGYLGLILIYLYISRSVILESEFLLLMIAFGFFGASIAIDAIFSLADLTSFIEDGFKFAGIVFWLVYFTRTAQAAVLRTFQSTLEHKNANI